MKQIIPHFFVDSVSDNVDYYRDKLGFEPIYVQNENGVVNFSILKQENVQIMAGDKELLWKYFPEYKDKQLLNPTLLYFEMTDVDAYYERVKLKAEIVKELQDTWYNTREFWVKDCNGYLLAFFQNI